MRLISFHCTKTTVASCRKWVRGRETEENVSSFKWRVWHVPFSPLSLFVSHFDERSHRFTSLMSSHIYISEPFNPVSSDTGGVWSHRITWNFHVLKSNNRCNTWRSSGLSVACGVVRHTREDLWYSVINGGAQEKYTPLYGDYGELFNPLMSFLFPFIYTRFDGFKGRKQAADILSPRRRWHSKPVCCRREATLAFICGLVCVHLTNTRLIVTLLFYADFSLHRILRWMCTS